MPKQGVGRLFLKTPTGTTSRHHVEEVHDDDDVGDEKERMIKLLVKFYTAAAAAGLIKIDDTTLPASLRGSKLVTDGILSPDKFKQFECLICYESCLPPVFGCVNGHLLCGDCQEGHKKACSQLPNDAPPPRYTCPFCRNPYFPIPMTPETRILQVILDLAPPIPPRKTD